MPLAHVSCKVLHWQQRCLCTLLLPPQSLCLSSFAHALGQLVCALSPRGHLQGPGLSRCRACWQPPASDIKYAEQDAQSNAHRTRNARLGLSLCPAGSRTGPRKQHFKHKRTAASQQTHGGTMRAHCFSMIAKAGEGTTQPQARSADIGTMATDNTDYFKRKQT